MQIIEKPDKTKISEPVALAIGSFDGLHIGHQQIIEKTKKIAECKKLKSGVYSFYPHPLEIINPEKAPGYLLSENQKIELLKNMDIDYYFRQKFTEEFSRIQFKFFIKNILLDNLFAKNIVVGHDFEFGYQGRGNVNSLKKLSRNYDFKVSVVSPVKVNGKIVSSSYVRNLICQGKLNDVEDFLGKNFAIEGTVIKGKGRGVNLGYPTANLNLHADYVLPPTGVYAGYVYLNGENYKGTGNFGYKPTYPDNDYSIEIYIHDFSEKIYEKTIIFEIMEYLRKEMNFKSQDKLKKQIKKDVLYTEQLLC